MLEKLKRFFGVRTPNDRLDRTERRMERLEQPRCDHVWKDIEVRFDNGQQGRYNVTVANSTDIQVCAKCEARRWKPILSSGTSNTNYGDLTIAENDNA